MAIREQHGGEPFNGPVQVSPEGLLGFLQLKNTGQNPHRLAWDYQMAIEARDWLFASRAQATAVASMNLAAGVTGFNVFTTNPIVVPNGEMWYVHSYSVLASLVNGETIYFRTAYALPNIAAFFGCGDAIQLSGAATARVAMVTMHPPGLFLPAGHQLGFYVSVNEGAANIEVSGTARYTRLGF